MTVMNYDDVQAALVKAHDKGVLERRCIDALDDILATFGFAAEGSHRLVALRALTPALLLHLDGDPSPVPDRHAFVDASGEVRISSALNSERIETQSGVVLYMNLRRVADSIRQNSA